MMNRRTATCATLLFALWGGWSCSDNAPEDNALDTDDSTTATSEGGGSGDGDVSSSSGNGDGDDSSDPNGDGDDPNGDGDGDTNGDGDGDDPNGDGDGDTNGDGDGDPDDCVQNPTTHLEIINACTDAVKVTKTPELSGLNEDGSLPPLP